MVEYESRMPESLRDETIFMLIELIEQKAGFKMDKLYGETKAPGQRINEIKEILQKDSDGTCAITEIERALLFNELYDLEDIMIERTEDPHRERNSEEE